MPAHLYVTIMMNSVFNNCKQAMIIMQDKQRNVNMFFLLFADFSYDSQLPEHKKAAAKRYRIQYTVAALLCNTTHRNADNILYAVFFMRQLHRTVCQSRNFLFISIINILLLLFYLIIRVKKLHRYMPVFFLIRIQNQQPQLVEFIQKHGICIHNIRGKNAHIKIADA